MSDLFPSSGLSHPSGDSASGGNRESNPGIIRYGAGFLIILAVLALGDVVASALALPLPGSVVGMVLMVGALAVGLIRLEWVRPMAELLLRHMALFFVPPGVALMLYFDLVAAEWLPIIVAGAFSTIAVMIAVGSVHQYLEPDE